MIRNNVIETILRIVNFVMAAQSSGWFPEIRLASAGEALKRQGTVEAGCRGMSRVTKNSRGYHEPWP
jgi:hypothetical protein